MTDEQNDREKLEKSTEETPSHEFHADDRDDDCEDVYCGITRLIVGFRDGDREVDAVEALSRLFTAIGDLLRLAEADGRRERRPAPRAADGERRET
jgi:hypothetical protein